MKKLLSRLATVFGYFIYALGVIIVLLWVLFPTDSARKWLEKGLNAESSLVWKIGRLKTTFPLKIKINNVRLYDPDDTENPVVTIQSVDLTPDIGEIVKMKKQLPMHYIINVFDGTVEGDLLVFGDVSEIKCDGSFKAIDTGKVEYLWETTGREGAGKLSGTFKYNGKWQEPFSGELDSLFDIQDGSISLQQPILGLDEVRFSVLSSKISMQNGTIVFEDGVVNSRLFNISYQGNLLLDDEFFESILEINGSMEPLSELFAGFENPMVVTLIRKEMENNKLAFSISGTLMKPGIQFKGSSGIIDGIVEGGLQ